MKYVIIGAGPAGVRAAETLREVDAGASITLVSGEPGEPYARMAIPYILTGRITEEGAQQRKTAGHFESLGIRYPNDKAMQVRAGAEGGSVDLDDGSRLEYDRLLVATGSSPTMLLIDGTDLYWVVHLLYTEHARAIAVKLKPGARVVMVGAGFVAGVCMKSLVETGVPFVGHRMALRSDPSLDDDAGRQYACCSAGWKTGCQCHHQGTGRAYRPGSAPGDGHASARRGSHHPRDGRALERLFP